MSYESKLECAFRELEAAKIWKSNYNPPLHRWLRRAGLKLRPPYYVSFLRNVAIRFIEMLFIFMPMLSFFRDDVTFSDLLYESLVVSAFYSLIMCSYYLWTFRRCELTRWDKL